MLNDVKMCSMKTSDKAIIQNMVTGDPITVKYLRVGSLGGGGVTESCCMAATDSILSAKI